MLDGRIWKSKNLDIEIPDSYCQEDNSVYCSRYGRLYTWEAALIGCEQLGEGWRLPTNEEWQNLTRQYGGFFNDSEDKGYSAYLNLIEGGRAGFNAVLGGNREENGDYHRLDAHGFYWTATETDSTHAWFLNFAKASLLLNRHKGDKQRALSVRCIKNPGN